MIEFNHFNFNVLNLEKSIAFYKEAIGLSVVREKDSSDGSFKIVYLGDGRTGFTLELTWMRDRNEKNFHPQRKEDEQPLRQLLFVLFYFLFVRYVSVEPD